MALDNERQDRIDLLRGREKRQEEEYHEAHSIFFSSVNYMDNTVYRVKGWPQISVAQFEREIRPTLAPRLEAANDALVAWLTTREELAALEGKKR